MFRRVVVAGWCLWGCERDVTHIMYISRHGEADGQRRSTAADASAADRGRKVDDSEEKGSEAGGCKDEGAREGGSRSPKLFRWHERCRSRAVGQRGGGGSDRRSDGSDATGEHCLGEDDVEMEKRAAEAAGLRVEESGDEEAREDAPPQYTFMGYDPRSCVRLQYNINSD